MIEVVLDLLPGGTRGNADDARHENDIDVLGFRWAAKPPIEESCSILILRKLLDWKSPHLASHCVIGRQLGETNLRAALVGRDWSFYCVRMRNLEVVAVIVESSETDANVSEGSRPVEEVTFRFSEAQTVWRPEPGWGPYRQQGVSTDPWRERPHMAAATRIFEAVALGFDIRPPTDCPL
jgi:type VI protein secretion system component Hcp